MGGSIYLEDLSATVVEVGSVGGRVFFEGPVVAGADYFLGSHGGTVTITIPESSNVSVSFTSVHGNITSDFPGVPELERGARNRFTLGSGGANIEAETFGGRIVLRRQGGDGL